MKNLARMTLAICTLFTVNVNAADSTWLVCSDKTLALSVFEHRSDDGENRETNLTLIKGIHNFFETLLTNDPSDTPDANGFQSVWISGTPENSEFFSGKIKIDYVTKKVSLVGDLYFDGSDIATKIKTVLNCKEMQ
ncbi:hypothetical protein CIK05_11300 [Bdellovibrio sp. qaytius]|nr:hypothetical protein CIK05_11300 [Bdellovibrio sp. qaytius]